MILKYIHKLTAAASSKKGAKWTIVIWILIMIVASGLSPGATQYATRIDETGLPSDARSMIDKEKITSYFKGDDGVPALLVFHQEDGLEEELQGIDLVSQAIDQENLEEIKEVVPVHNFPDELKRTFMSENETT